MPGLLNGYCSIYKLYHMVVQWRMENKETNPSLTLRVLKYRRIAGMSVEDGCYRLIVAALKGPPEASHTPVGNRRSNGPAFQQDGVPTGRGFCFALCYRKIGSTIVEARGNVV
jgi:hypothetical protein